jgi:hypothetical protein
LTGELIDPHPIGGPLLIGNGVFVAKLDKTDGHVIWKKAARTCCYNSWTALKWVEYKEDNFTVCFSYNFRDASSANQYRHLAYPSITNINLKKRLKSTALICFNFALIFDRKSLIFL